MATPAPKRGKKRPQLIQKKLDEKEKIELMKLFEEAMPDIVSLTKKSHGRPSIMTENVVAKLRFAFIMGSSDVEACTLSGINKATLYRYQSKHPDFCDQKVHLRSYMKLRARMTILRNINDMNIAKWYLERKATKEFNRCSVDGPRPLPRLTPEQEKRAAEILGE